MGIAYDDDDFLLKIIANKIKIINLFYDKYNFGGIHLWHNSIIKKIRKKIETNQNIFNKKTQNYEEIGEYIEIINNIPEKIKIEKLDIELNNKINLLKLQELILQIKGEKFINFYINKKKYISYSVNSFRKCYLKGYCYKNSGLKIPKNLIIKFYYI
jgi:hypothetical protein